LVSWVLRPASAEGPTTRQILEGAEARIEKHRKGDGVVRVVDAAGRPVAGATVQVEQTRHAFLFGCNIYWWGHSRTPEQEEAYRRRFADLLNYATLAFYWNGYEPQQGRPDHAHWEQVAQWCKENGVVTKGHPLAWNHTDPPWLPDEPNEVMALQLGRITDCVSRFRGLIDRWDVVNEATTFDNPEFLKRSPKLSRTWQQIGQIEFARRCFKAARAANPSATLLINDYVTTPAYAKIIEQLVDDSGKRLYDVIGIQSHMHLMIWTPSLVWDVCERFARFGVPLHFTETTILSGRRPSERGKPWLSTPEGEAFQARETVRFYTLLFSHPAVQAITWWDFSDQGAWQGAPAGWLRHDMSPKPVYLAMKDLIKGKWWTARLDGKTDKGGEFRFRGFKGTYRVKVDTPDGRSGRQTLELGDRGEVIVRMSASSSSPGEGK